MYLLISQSSSQELSKRLISSIDFSQCTVILVNQTKNSINDNRVIEIIYGSQISLSKSRNLALKFARNQGWYSKVSHILFPDDDAFYFKNFWDEFSPIDKSYLTNIIYQNREFIKWWKSGPLKYLNVMSSNLVIKKEHLEDLIFDEDLGLGTYYGSGEDIDIFWKVGAKNFIIKRNWRVNHPILTSPDLLLTNPEKLKNYFRGHTKLCFSHKKYTPLVVSILYSAIIFVTRPNNTNFNFLKFRVLILIKYIRSL